MFFIFFVIFSNFGLECCCKNSLSWGWLSASPSSSLIIIAVEKTLDGFEFEYPKEMFQLFLFFEILRITLLLVYVRITIFFCHFIIQLQEWQNNPPYFANYPFLLSELIIEVNTLSIFIRRESYAKKKFRIFQKFL